MPHDRLKQRANYYEEVESDHRAKDEVLKVLKRGYASSLSKSNVKKHEKHSRAALEKSTPELPWMGQVC